MSSSSSPSSRRRRSSGRSSQSSGAASGAKLRSRSQRGVSDPKEHQKLNKPKTLRLDGGSVV